MNAPINVGVDLDGTLLDSRARHAVALEVAAAQTGVALPRGLAERFVQDKAEGLTGWAVLEGAGVPLADAILERWVSLIETPAMLAHDVLYPGAIEALASHRDRGMRFFLVTARQDPEAVLVQLERLGVAAMCERVAVVAPRFRRVDGVDAKAEVSSGWALSAVIGDTEDDRRWAQALAVPFYAVGTGFRNAAFWTRAGLACHADLGAALRALSDRPD